ncbi:NUDIX domain-containing protein [Microbispora sp. CA-102843]|uniref:NUDIX domain-containing protein n=1 Tax=Microbispora sp. CA-102843 TaxID=3239952 RepID=UPI003D8A2F31
MFCGAAYAPGLPWPRTCQECGNTSYLNPLPVAVMVLPVDDGLLVVRRDVEPHRGLLALPGGFIDIGESWQQAAVREFHEETGVVLPMPASPRPDPFSILRDEFDLASG